MAAAIHVKKLSSKVSLNSFRRWNYHVKMCVSWREFSYRLCSTSNYKIEQPLSVNLQLSDDRSMKLSSGKYARMADGSAVAEIGETSVLVTVVSKTSNKKSSFIPLTVDYKQKYAAAGRIPMNFFRRETGPTDTEILTGRLIDRSVRPLFPLGYSNDTHIVCNLLAVDGINNPDIACINATSTALALSDVPWFGPVAAVRVGWIDGKPIINPTKKEMSLSVLNLVITGSQNNQVMMVEAAADNMLLQDFQKALKKGVKETQVIIKKINDLRNMGGRVKRDFVIQASNEELCKVITDHAEARIKDIFTDYSHDKMSRDVAVSKLRNEVSEHVSNECSETSVTEINDIFQKVCKDTFRRLILDTDVRCDGRKLQDVRKIACEVDLFKPLHGSALFQRGQTQCLCTVTFDSLDSALKADAVTVLTGGLKEKNFMLHYEFPQFAVNETGSSRVGRREIGHGALAEKALRPLIPDNFPFTIRLTSEVLESNGSSSMASVCGGSLALMDAGVPLKSAAAGVAIGLVCSEDGARYKLLTDILGIEDYLGDMDFKIAGSKKGVTALQCDIKLPGVPMKIIMEAIQQGHDAKSKILNIMNDTISKPRLEKKPNAPVCENFQVSAHQRSKFVGLGGYNLKKLTSETGVQITSIDETTFSIFAPNQIAMDEAKDHIKDLLEEEKIPELEFGGVYRAKIVELKETGVLVTLHPNMNPAFLPNSQLDNRKVSDPSVLGLEVNDEISVKYFGIDPVSGKMRLSRKVLQMPSVSSLPKNMMQTAQPQVSDKSTFEKVDDAKSIS